MSMHPRSSFIELLRLIKPMRGVLMISIVLGILGGLSITGLLATINASLHSDSAGNLGLLLAFGGLCVMALVGSILSDIGTNYVGQHVIARLRIELGRRILSAPIDQLESYRSHKLTPVLTHDVDTISDFAFVLAPLAVSLSVTLGCLAYLANLSLPMFLTTVVAVLIGSAVQYLARVRGIKGFFEAREHEDELQKQYRAISEGAKELRINRSRRLRLFEDKLKGTTQRICDIQVRSIKLFVIAKGFGSTLFFIVIGVALAFQALWPSTDKATLSGFILVLLYMKGPLEHLIGTLPIVSRAQVAFKRIADLSARFSSPEPHLMLADTRPAPTSIDSLELRDVRYTYPRQPDTAPFELGPINLKVKRGEILFIVGENGCGKTTLIKLLLGLYVPQQGAILQDGQPVTPEHYDDYRQLFTTIFSDYFLFDDLIQADEEVPVDAEQYLQRLEICHKVNIKEGKFSTTDLSTGQRKRLALLQAWTEKRPVLVFDEWAADQDPTFRRIFYSELLPSLKAMGKTIIVISHDDRYFDCADHLLKLESGKVLDEMTAA
ncbi:MULTISPECIES: cyclic peptide export ABC transporter [unclassified Pseudomonas]|uniref:cyclic peptide export ABC transporter n=1 Tax=unclassified Pseudomonas TaxID=196821 RepID=UPI0021BA74C2|nr:MULTISPECIES: cyclic peptide export ABC transporter [unclassified Pseudomonas]MCT8162556.1 cyclic peptide export ABC transporter [Pseudomonas sp. HD6422]MCT8184362.1 cyclic peptide export ABC transporter [Pseudomonas sp. HD6421]